MRLIVGFYCLPLLIVIIYIHHFQGKNILSNEYMYELAMSFYRITWLAVVVQSMMYYLLLLIIININ
jgi:hypothetical protein